MAQRMKRKRFVTEGTLVVVEGRLVGQDLLEVRFIDLPPAEPLSSPLPPQISTQPIHYSRAIQVSFISCHSFNVLLFVLCYPYLDLLLLLLAGDVEQTKHIK